MKYIYGSVVINSGIRFRARLDEESGKVSFMTHRGQQNASAKIAKTFKPDSEAAVSPSNRYLFPDEYLNANASQANSKAATWKQH